MMTMNTHQKFAPRSKIDLQLHIQVKWPTQNFSPHLTMKAKDRGTLCVCVCACECEYVCVCVTNRERDSERKRKRRRKIMPRTEGRRKKRKKLWSVLECAHIWLLIATVKLCWEKPVLQKSQFIRRKKDSTHLFK